MCRAPFYFGLVGVRKFFTRKGIKALAVLLLSPFEAEKITFEAHEEKLAGIHGDNWININLEREAFIKEFKAILQGGMNKWWRKFTRLFKVNFIPIQSSAGKVANNCNFRCQIVVHSVAELKFNFLVVWPSAPNFFQLNANSEQTLWNFSCTDDFLILFRPIYLPKLCKICVEQTMLIIWKAPFRLTTFSNRDSCLMRLSKCYWC